MTVAVLMTCHNRCKITLRCLDRLAMALKQCSDLEFDVWLVDDGSSDGTACEVRSMFPCVHIIPGNGNLFWAKGMHKAWKTAKKNKEYDFFLWLNDDVVLRTDAIVNAYADCKIANGVIVGACSEDEFERVCSYGATDSFDRKIIPCGTPQKATGWLNGNFVLVPREVFQRVGMISNEYTHARADYDYAERLNKLGIPFYCSSYYVGFCRNDFIDKVKYLGFLARLKLLVQPGYFNLHDLWLIRRRYHGVWRAFVSCLHMILIVLRGWR